MDQYLNNRQNEILWRLLANPADNGNLYGFNLQQLTKDFPQSGLLQALLARANGGENLPHAAASFNTKALYVMMNAYENLAEVSEEQIVQELSAAAHYSIEQDEPVLKLNDFSDGRLKDILGFEPVTGDEPPAEKVVVAEDERSEVENMQFEPVQTEQLIENEHPEEPLSQLQETEIAPEIITAKDIEELEGLIETPAEDHRTDAQLHPFEEEVVEHTAILKEEEPVAESPAEDHRANAYLHPYEEEVIEYIETVKEEELIFAELPVEDHRADVQLHPFEEETIEHIVTKEAEKEPIAELPAEDHRLITDLSPYEEEIIEISEATEEEPGIEIPAEDQLHEEELQEQPIINAVHRDTSKDIDDEVYDEIVGIDSISFAFASKPEEAPVQTEYPASEHIVMEHDGQPETSVEDTRDEIGKLMSEELLAADYFGPEKVQPLEPGISEPDTVTVEQETFSSPLNEVSTPATADTETQNVSKYHDEKMPYTFMWWLDKTRKEHAGIYQPFKLDTTQAIRHTADEMLQQQYYENIFHISTISELDKDPSKPPVEFDMQNKEDRIIKKFIIEEPHISTPTGDKLDNENKAKRSAEDQDELVTETLARIYVDQMLYHKAINTYKKLILKFPEKSRYFADHIELLERKIN